MITRLCCFVLVARVLVSLSAAFSTGPVVHSERSTTTGLTPTASDRRSAESRLLSKQPQVFRAPFAQSLETYTIDGEGLCTARNTVDHNGDIWEYFFWDAKCDESAGLSQLAIITCGSKYKDRYGQLRMRGGKKKTILHMCPEKTLCRRVYRINPEERAPLEEVVCVDEADVKTELVTPANSHADPNAPGVHCGLSLAIPGTVFTVKPGVQSIDITLTEEVRYRNGAPYPAPMIYIRDKTSRRAFDRVFRRHASVASTQVTLTAVKGKFQTRTFEFCMQLLPGLTASAATFSYSWFQTTSRHGRVPGQYLSSHQA